MHHTDKQDIAHPESPLLPFLEALRDRFVVLGGDKVGACLPAGSTTLMDLTTGDTYTVTVTGFVAATDLHAVLAVTPDAAVSAHGPFNGAPAATAHAGAWGGGSSTAMVRVVALYDPTEQRPPEQVWQPIPRHLAERMRPESDDGDGAVVVLADGDHGCVLAVGPFPSLAAADEWQPTWTFDRLVDWHLVPLHLPFPTPG